MLQQKSNLQIFSQPFDTTRFEKLKKGVRLLAHLNFKKKKKVKNKRERIKKNNNNKRRELKKKKKKRGKKNDAHKKGEFMSLEVKKKRGGVFVFIVFRVFLIIFFFLLSVCFLTFYGFLCIFLGYFVYFLEYYFPWLEQDMVTLQNQGLAPPLFFKTKQQHVGQTSQ